LEEEGFVSYRLDRRGEKGKGKKGGGGGSLLYPLFLGMEGDRIVDYQFTELSSKKGRQKEEEEKTSLWQNCLANRRREKRGAGGECLDHLWEGEEERKKEEKKLLQNASVVEQRRKVNSFTPDIGVLTSYAVLVGGGKKRGKERRPFFLLWKGKMGESANPFLGKGGEKRRKGSQFTFLTGGGDRSGFRLASCWGRRGGGERKGERRRLYPLPTVEMGEFVVVRIQTKGKKKGGKAYLHVRGASDLCWRGLEEGKGGKVLFLPSQGGVRKGGLRSHSVKKSARKKGLFFFPPPSNGRQGGGRKGKGIVNYSRKRNKGNDDRPKRGEKGEKKKGAATFSLEYGESYALSLGSRKRRKKEKGGKGGKKGI